MVPPPPPPSESAHMGGFTHEKRQCSCATSLHNHCGNLFFPKQNKNKVVIHAWQMYALDMSSKFQK